MLKLLLRLHQLLTSDATLTAIVPAENIGASVRTNTEWPCLEYGIGEAPRRDPKGHTELTLVLLTHSTVGAQQAWEMAERVHVLLTATNLSDPSEGFKVSKCNQFDARTSPRNPWASSVRSEYRVWVSEARPDGPTQKQ